MGASSDYPAGSTGGSATHVLTSAELADHQHELGTSHPGNSGRQWTIPQWEWYVDATQVGAASGKTTYGMWTINSKGKATPINILNPYLAVYIWKRTS